MNKLKENGAFKQIQDSYETQPQVFHGLYSLGYGRRIRPFVANCRVDHTQTHFELIFVSC